MSRLNELVAYVKHNRTRLPDYMCTQPYEIQKCPVRRCEDCIFSSDSVEHLPLVALKELLSDE